jgi:uncharacterized protein
MQTRLPAATPLRRNPLASSKPLSSAAPGCRLASQGILRLILFCRVPGAGPTKTRLAADLAADLGVAAGSEMAARIYEACLMDCLTVALDVTASPVLCFSPSHAGGLLLNWLADKLPDWDPVIQPQVEGNLGRRMAAALAAALNGPDRAAVLIGTDCPAITPAAIVGAFRMLERNDLSFGPAFDGGFYLVGVRRPISRPAADLLGELFAGIGWSQADTLGQVLQRARALDLTAGLVEKSFDIDTGMDLERARAGLKALQSGATGQHTRAIIEELAQQREAGDHAR